MSGLAPSGSQVERHWLSRLSLVLPTLVWVSSLTTGSGCHPGNLGNICACRSAATCPAGCPTSDGDGDNSPADGSSLPDASDPPLPDGDASAPGDSGDEPPPEPLFNLDCAQHPELLHPIFTSHMVIQRNAWAPVWGCITPGGEVSVAFAGQTVTATADTTGLWKLRFEPLPAGGPHTLTVTSTESRTLTDVLIGDVWLCSGQSNMEMVVQDVLNAAQEIADAANYPSIRLFTVPAFRGSPVPEQVFRYVTGWEQTDSSTVAGFSATCYFFARGLSQRTAVPQGLINSSYGGTAIEWWMSAASLATDPDFEAEIAEIAAGNYPLDDFYPTSLFNGMVAPLLPFELRGFVWYQGETNAGRAVQYRRLLANMILDWRYQFGGGEKPFLIVQLPRYGTPQTAPSEGGWAGIREAELLVAKSVPGAGLAVTIDTGEADYIHPRDKQDVGDRLAVLARGLAYGEPIAFQGPTYRSMQIEGSSIRISFDGAPTGLMIGSKQPLTPVVEDATGELSAFAVAGADRNFVWATATIDGADIVVWAPGLEAPVAVRYGWAINPACNLYGKEGLPVSPFRTDNW